MCGEMGSDQSTSSAADQRQRNPGNLPFQGEASSSSIQTDTGPEPRDHLDPDTDLPQCRIGTRKVDDMSFMISCTNWY
ncbi:hypothetical protein R3I94_011368 [Phoxinus phoxinus]